MRHLLLSHAILYGAIAALILLGTQPSALRTLRIRLLAAVLAGLFVLGQAMHAPALTYPFIPWTMYAGPSSPTASRMVVLDNHGTRSDYPFRLIAFSSPRAFLSRVEALVADCRCSSRDLVTDSVLKALARLYESETHAVVTSIVLEKIDIFDDHRSVAYQWDQVQAR